MKIFENLAVGNVLFERMDIVAHSIRYFILFLTIYIFFVMSGKNVVF